MITQGKIDAKWLNRKVVLWLEYCSEKKITLIRMRTKILINFIFFLKENNFCCTSVWWCPKVNTSILLFDNIPHMRITHWARFKHKRSTLLHFSIYLSSNIPLQWVLYLITPKISQCYHSGTLCSGGVYCIVFTVISTVVHINAQ